MPIVILKSRNHFIQKEKIGIIWTLPLRKPVTQIQISNQVKCKRHHHNQRRLPPIPFRHGQRRSLLFLILRHRYLLRQGPSSSLAPVRLYSASLPLTSVFKYSLICNVCCCRGIRKMKNTLSPASLKEKLPGLLQKCAKTFQSDRRYRSDMRYLRVWLQLVTEAPFS